MLGLYLFAIYTIAIFVVLNCIFFTFFDSVAAEMQTGGMLTWPPPLVVGGLITPLLIYMPFLHVARSSDP